MPKLIDALAPALVDPMRSLGFEPRVFKIASKARAFMQLKSGGTGFARQARDGQHEFVYFQAGTDGQLVTAFVGWSPQPGVIPAPLDAFDFPDPGHAEYQREEYLCPLFALWHDPPGGRRHHAVRLEGDNWLLVSAGPIPQGETDEALARGISAQLAARTRSAEIIGTERQAASIADLAQRIRTDLAEVLLPYLAARVDSRSDVVLGTAGSSGHATVPRKGCP